MKVTLLVNKAHLILKNYVGREGQIDYYALTVKDKADIKECTSVKLVLVELLDALWAFNGKCIEKQWPISLQVTWCYNCASDISHFTMGMSRDKPLMKKREIIRDRLIKMLNNRRLIVHPSEKQEVTLNLDARRPVPQRRNSQPPANPSMF